MLSYKTYLLLFLLGTVHQIFAQNKAIDVQHYRYEIELNDNNDTIQGKATIRFITKQRNDKVYFDLTGKNSSNGKGMKVVQVKAGGQTLDYKQKNNRVYIYYKNSVKTGKEKSVSITYKGIPTDGLIISKNKYGDRTFFADNWPERAHNWIPSNDHPSDKATVDFLITAPAHYRVVGNGKKVGETILSPYKRVTHWSTALAIPTKVMAIGVADFAVQEVGKVDGIPVQIWVFPQNREEGFKEYAISADILPFYINYIGSYPYQKLANVQSKTRFGGLENASNIFYSENSVFTDTTHSSQKQYKLDALIAHETAHQWFGDQVSETDWSHLWLSEGFASYLPDLYFESRYGEDTLKARLSRHRQTVINFSKRRNTPVVDTTVTNLMELLNPNSYQKGEWILHMLRRKLGDSLFQKSIRSYYTQYNGKNASTDDFRKVLEEVSSENLKLFFKQWLYTPGQPDIDVRWHYDKLRKSLEITIDQEQNVLFEFSLGIEINARSHKRLKIVTIKDRHSIINIPLSFQPEQLILDPEINLLFEGKVEKTP